MLHNKPRVQRRAVLCSRGEWRWSTTRNEKQTVAWEWLNGAPSVCVRFILARFGISIKNRPPLTMYETA